MHHGIYSCQPHDHGSLFLDKRLLYRFRNGGDYSTLQSVMTRPFVHGETITFLWHFNLLKPFIFWMGELELCWSRPILTSTIQLKRVKVKVSPQPKNWINLRPWVDVSATLNTGGIMCCWGVAGSAVWAWKVRHYYLWKVLPPLWSHKHL